MQSLELKNFLTQDTVDGLLTWYRNNRRDLPWRHTSDPYRIWVSEIMLQQTRVEAVKRYYTRFLEEAPSADALAHLPEDRLLKLWEGLGYYSRARNLQKAAKTIVERYGGKLPTSYADLRRLPGIGDYTAGAVASIAYNERVPAVDGNVLRVLARVSGCSADISLQETKTCFRDALAEVIPPAAGDFTQSMIELGAMVCVPNGTPLCAECPLAHCCRAHALGLIDRLPVKAAKKARRVEEKTVFLIRDGEHTVLHKRPAKGLLSGLYEFPNTEGFLEDGAVLDYIRSIGFEPLRLSRLEAAKHIFTHVEWHMIAYDVRITPEFDDFRGVSGMLTVRNDELRTRYAIPSAFAAYTKYLS